MSPSIGGGVTWTIGTWTSPLLDLSLQKHADSDDDEWGLIMWEEENTEDESEAYVRVDILDSAGAVLQADIESVKGDNYNYVDLSGYVSSTSKVDVYVKFKLYAKSKKPVIKMLKIDSAR